MNHAAITAGFYISLCGILPAGVILMILWAKKILRPTLAGVEARAAKTGYCGAQEIAIRALFFMMPGLFVFILFSVPVLFFSNLLQQYDHCIQVIRVNKMTPEKDRQNEFLAEKAKWLNIDELFERANSEHAGDNARN